MSEMVVLFLYMRIEENSRKCNSGCAGLARKRFLLFLEPLFFKIAMSCYFFMMKKGIAFYFKGT